MRDSPHAVDEAENGGSVQTQNENENGRAPRERRKMGKVDPGQYPLACGRRTHANAEGNGVVRDDLTCPAAAEGKTQLRKPALLCAEICEPFLFEPLGQFGRSVAGGVVDEASRQRGLGVGGRRTGEVVPRVDARTARPIPGRKGARTSPPGR